MDLHDALRAEFGTAYGDLRTSLPANPAGPNGPFRTRPLDGVRYLAIHHTAGPKDVSWAAVAREHIRPVSDGGRLGAAGIGYHVGIQRGRVAYLGDIMTARANVGGLNHLVVGVCVSGDYTRESLDPADRDALARVVRVLDAYFGRALDIDGHGRLPGQSTACPGTALLAVLPALRSGAPSAPPSAPTALSEALLAAGEAARKMRVNRTAAIYRAIIGAGFTPASNEFEVVHDGTRYVGQLAESPRTGEVRVYHARAGDWQHVEAVSR
jgi:hypothetical protein